MFCNKSFIKMEEYKEEISLVHDDMSFEDLLNLASQNSLLSFKELRPTPIITDKENITVKEEEKISLLLFVYVSLTLFAISVYFLIKK